MSFVWMASVKVPGEPEGTHSGGGVAGGTGGTGGSGGGAGGRGDGGGGGGSSGDITWVPDPWSDAMSPAMSPELPPPLPSSLPPCMSGKSGGDDGLGLTGKQSSQPLAAAPPPGEYQTNVLPLVGTMPTGPLVPQKDTFSTQS